MGWPSWIRSSSNFDLYRHHEGVKRKMLHNKKFFLERLQNRKDWKTEHHENGHGEMEKSNLKSNMIKNCKEGNFKV